MDPNSPNSIEANSPGVSISPTFSENPLCHNYFDSFPTEISYDSGYPNLTSFKNRLSRQRRNESTKGFK